MTIFDNADTPERSVVEHGAPAAPREAGTFFLDA